MSEIQRPAESLQRHEQPIDAERERELNLADEVKEAFAKLGQANGRFAELCRDYLFADEKALSKTDQNRRFALQDNFEHGGEAVGDCTISTHNKHNTLRIDHGGEQYDYIWYDARHQSIYPSTYPSASAINLHGSKPAEAHGIDHRRFRVATREDIAQYERTCAEAKQLAAEIESKRTTFSRIVASFTGKRHEPVYPARPEETPNMYPAAIRIANDAAAALDAAATALEHLKNPELGTLPSRGEKMLQILEKAEREQNTRSDK